MAFTYEINPKPEHEILADLIFEKLKLNVQVNLNHLDGKIHILSEDELKPDQLAAITAVLREVGRP